MHLTKFILCIQVFLLNLTAVSQNVGIGTTVPQQKLDVNGAIKISEAGSQTPVAGTIQWNPAKREFEGFNGTAWVSLSGGMNGWGNQQQWVTENESPNAYQSPATGDKWGTGLGNSLASYGDIVVAGNPDDLGTNNSSNGYSQTGSMVVFRYGPNGWYVSKTVKNPHPTRDAQFGKSVAMDDKRIVAGAPQARIGNEAYGRFYIFNHQNNMAEEASFWAPDREEGDYFGYGVAIYNDMVAVSAPRKIANGILGKIYIYRHDGSGWKYNSYLQRPDANDQTGDGFGTSIAMWGEYLAVANSNKRVDGYVSVGKVYVYRRSGSIWLLIGQLTAPDGIRFGQHFGSSISIHNNILVVGAPYSTAVNTGIGDVGRAYIYQLSGNNITHVQSITAGDVRRYDLFGSSVSIANDIIVVGSPDANMQANTQQGKSYVFRNINGQWQEQAMLKSSTGREGGRFGRAAAVLNGYVAVSAPYDDLGTVLRNGRVYFFKKP